MFNVEKTDKVTEEVDTGMTIVISGYDKGSSRKRSHWPVAVDSVEKGSRRKILPEKGEQTVPVRPTPPAVNRTPALD